MVAHGLPDRGDALPRDGRALVLRAGRPRAARARGGARVLPAAAGASRGPSERQRPRPPSAWRGWRSVVRTHGGRAGSGPARPGVVGCGPASCCWGALGRERILRRLDSWTHPEGVDQRRALATAAAALAQAGSIRTAARAIKRAARRGCGSPAVLAAAVDPAHAEAFHAPDAAVTPLARTSAIAHLLESVGGTLRVHPDDESSVFPLLPCDDAAWVVETAADAIVGRAGSRGASWSGSWRSGRRFGRPHRAARWTCRFLEALGAGRGAGGRAVATDACWGRPPVGGFAGAGVAPDCGNGGRCG